jgi:acyl-CoA synthetase (AMP-forming)/AMP-acid ligase II
MTLDTSYSSPRIVDLLAAAASQRPDAAALVAGAGRAVIAYSHLVRLADDLAGQLIRGGLQSGDVVALRGHSNAEFAVALLGASRAGLVVVPVDSALPVADQYARIAAAGARVALVDDRQTATVHDPGFPCWPVSVSVGPRHRDGGVTLDTTAQLVPSPVVPDGLQPDDDALVMFTGGTTGSPKLVPWTHDNVATSIGNVVASYGLGPDDATVAVMPLFHGHGLIASLLATLVSGGTVLLPAGGRFSVHTFAGDVRAAHATWFTAVPTIHQMILNRTASDTDRPPLRFVRSCSAPLTEETAQALQSEFAAPVLSAYGMTEATHQAASTSEHETVAPGLVGRPTGVEFRIVGAAGRPSPPDVVGEIWIRGRTVVRGYLANPTATTQTFTDGWLHTGDLGSLSAAGELTLRGRIKELINRGGEKISPERVEGVLASHPNVAEAAVFGVPDRLYGETVAAVIVPNQSAPPTATELAEFARERLAAFEVPASIELTDELPHTAKGSLDRRAVADKFGRAD